MECARKHNYTNIFCRQTVERSWTPCIYPNFMLWVLTSKHRWHNICLRVTQFGWKYDKNNPMYVTSTNYYIFGARIHIYHPLRLRIIKHVHYEQLLTKQMRKLSKRIDTHVTINYHKSSHKTQTDTFYLLFCENYL